MRTRSYGWTVFAATVFAAVVAALSLLSMVSVRDRMRAAGLESEAAINHIMRRHLVQEGAAIAEVLSGILVNPLYQYDMRGMKQILSGVRKLQDVEYVVVFAADGTVVHDGTDTITNFGRLMDDALAPDVIAATEPRALIAVGVLDLSAPIMLGDRRLGGVRVGVSDARLQGEIGEAVNQVTEGYLAALDRDAIALVIVVVGMTSLGALLVAAVVRGSFAADRARAYETQLLRAERVHMMGEMASTLAHELNQPLAAIVNFSRGALRRMEAPEIDRPAMLSALGRVSSEALRASEIIRNVGTFLRKDPVVPTPADINAVIRAVVGMANGRAKSEGAVIHLDLAGGLPRVEAGIVELEQVVLNLLFNALDAVKEQSKRSIKISTWLEEGQSVCVSVSDTGCGLPRGSAEMLFQAFFTTKAEGMGMGLRISRTIVESRGGVIRAKDNAGGGATVYFTLPVATA